MSNIIIAVEKTEAYDTECDVHAAFSMDVLRDQIEYLNDSRPYVSSNGKFLYDDNRELEYSLFEAPFISNTSHYVIYPALGKVSVHTTKDLDEAIEDDIRKVFLMEDVSIELYERTKYWRAKISARMFEGTMDFYVLGREDMVELLARRGGGGDDD